MKKIKFYEDELLAEQDEAGQVWVPLRPVCEALGLDDRSQRQKLESHAWATGVVITSTGKDGKHYKMFCLAVNSVPMWLATIQAGRVKLEVRQKLVLYQKEARDALARAFLTERGEVRQDTALADLMANINMRLDRQDQELVEIKVISQRNTSEIELLQAQLNIIWMEDEKAKISDEMKLTAKSEGLTMLQVAGKVRAGCDISKIYTKDSARRVVNFLRAMRGEGIRVVKDEGEGEPAD